MTTATIATWERTGRDTRAPFALASELHFDPTESTATAHADGVVNRYLARAEHDGLRLGMYGHVLAVLARPGTSEVERVVTYAEWPDAWDAARVGALVARVENTAQPVSPDRRN